MENEKYLAARARIQRISLGEPLTVVYPTEFECIAHDKMLDDMVIIYEVENTSEAPK